MFSLIQSALFIFFLRIIDVTLMTLRMLMVVRGRKLLSWVFGFAQAVVFVLALRQVLTDINNWLNLIGYAAGFATGNVVGIVIEEKIAIGHTHLRIISTEHGSEVAERLRAAGFAATEIAGCGMNGPVTLINCSVLRKSVEEVRRLVEETDPQAMITAEDVRPVRRGFWRA